MFSASTLLLILSSIIYWQIREIERAVEEADEEELAGQRQEKTAKRALGLEQERDRGMGLWTLGGLQVCARRAATPTA